MPKTRDRLYGIHVFFGTAHTIRKRKLLASNSIDRYARNVFELDQVVERLRWSASIEGVLLDGLARHSSSRNLFGLQPRPREVGHEDHRRRNDPHSEHRQLGSAQAALKRRP